MKKRRKQSGFTLIELIVAASLSAIVLIGAFSLMSSMVQNEISGMRSGTVTAWTLASINVMNTDIAGSSYLAYPSPGSAQDSLVTCTNWSAIANPGPSPGRVNSALPVTAYEYCYSPASNAILRYVVSGVGACPAAPAACAVGVYSVVATGVYRDAASDPVFLADPASPNANAVRLRFVVGNPNPGVSAGSNMQTSVAVPQSIAFDTRIVLED